MAAYHFFKGAFFVGFFFSGSFFKGFFLTVFDVPAAFFKAAAGFFSPSLFRPKVAQTLVHRL